MDRKQIAHNEATRDPIFLFQIRNVIPNQECLAEYNSDIESYYDPDTKVCLNDDDLIRRGWAAEVWRTETVFLTRKEAESFGDATSYRYGKGRKNIDWMVYCCALEKDSVLAQMLQHENF